MSHYTVEFKGTRAEREAQALKEVKTYLGTARYLNIRRAIVDGLIPEGISWTGAYASVCFSMALVGVRGYWPQRAVAREVLRIVRNCRERQAVASIQG